MIPCLQTPESRQSKNIEKQISTWMKDYNKAIKLLLLGAGESGKTTIIKQMKILHIRGFSEEEQREKSDEIRRNVLESMATLCQQLEPLGIAIQHQSNAGAVSSILQLWNNEASQDSLDQEFYDNVSSLWRDEGIRAVYGQQHRFHLIDCAKYFLDKVDAVRDSDYLPSIQDILNSRHITTDIQKIEFDATVPKRYGGGQQSFWMFDVGGQKGERKKWIQVFDGIQAVLFLVASNCFDLMTREDDTTNRLDDSLDIFENVWTSRFLQNAGFIIFLNKQDKLREKIIEERKSLEDAYPEYSHYKLLPRDNVTGENEEYLRARCFIRDQFLDISRLPSGGPAPRKRSIAPGVNFPQDSSEQRECYSHFTTATDTDNVKLVFNDVHDMIIRINLKEIGIH